MSGFSLQVMKGVLKSTAEGFCKELAVFPGLFRCAAQSLILIPRFYEPFAELSLFSHISYSAWHFDSWHYTQSAICCRKRDIGLCGDSIGWIPHCQNKKRRKGQPQLLLWNSRGRGDIRHVITNTKQIDAIKVNELRDIIFPSGMQSFEYMSVCSIVAAVVGLFRQ